jgi:membrane protease YdiL (CAAX protease family)
MTVAAHPRLAHRPGGRALPLLIVAAAGCGALAARLRLSWPVVGVTLAVGIAGALSPADADDDRGTTAGWLAAVALGVGAFAAIRISSAIPTPGPGIKMLTLAIVAAVAEELFFRRFLYGFLLRRGTAVAIAGSALAFALVHIPAYGAAVFPIDLAAGLLLSWQRWATGSWTAPAVTHAAANLLSIL